jgi:hypothetical protein
LTAKGRSGREGWKRRWRREASNVRKFKAMDKERVGEVLQRVFSIRHVRGHMDTQRARESRENRETKNKETESRETERPKREREVTALAQKHRLRKRQRAREREGDVFAYLYVSSDKPGALPQWEHKDRGEKRNALRHPFSRSPPLLVFHNHKHRERMEKRGMSAFADGC